MGEININKAAELYFKAAEQGNVLVRVIWAGCMKMEEALEELIEK